ncbi:hypothetical protein [Botrimarina hoheduenensis]|uniref:Uncharacterized protein n=1 Tax=Botrimarina hoheduenensis TaxID=2528000 RepID=A0A5C5VYX9_9BACT|nr:hypothetical protein [Botrimarina hoheduenensis]TWT42941.1 hypothetical protein Pla111_25790 [Botrimarina hoheduenensis]
MPTNSLALRATQRVARDASEAIRYACRQLSDHWTVEERQQRQIAADRMQADLATTLGLRQQLAYAPVPRRS